MLTFYVSLKNGEIDSYRISSTFDYNITRDYNIYNFSIEIDQENFINFREALSRFLEWESVAQNNNITEVFIREIPITVTSNNVTWSIRTDTGLHRFSNERPLIIRFNFLWDSVFTRGQLYIRSNTLNDGTPNYFLLEKRNMNREEIRFLFEGLSDDKIQEAIEQGRIRDLEREEQRQLIDDLFN